MDYRKALIFIIIVSLTLDYSMQDSSAKPKRRLKRYLGFKQGTKFFFRLNIKDNVMKKHQIWAHAFGFRQNFEIPMPLPKAYRVRRSDVHDNMELLLNQHGFDGRACILKSFCDASKMVTPQSGIFFKLFKKIFTMPTYKNNSIPEDDENLYPYLKSEDCEELQSHCPLGFLDMLPYTDI